MILEEFLPLKKSCRNSKGCSKVQVLGTCRLKRNEQHFCCSFLQFVHVLVRRENNVELTVAIVAPLFSAVSHRQEGGEMGGGGG